MKIDNSFTAFLAVCEEVKTYLKLNSYEITTYESDAEVNFRLTHRIQDIHKLSAILKDYQASIVQSEGFIVLRISQLNM